MYILALITSFRIKSTFCKELTITIIAVVLEENIAVLVYRCEMLKGINLIVLLIDFSLFSP